MHDTKQDLLIFAIVTTPILGVGLFFMGLIGWINS